VATDEAIPSKRKTKKCMYHKTFYVYILANKYNRVLYVGVSNDLVRRIHEHKTKFNKGFTARYNVDKLVYFEETDDIGWAICREKQLKCGSRQDKINLIIVDNPNWLDLSEGWV